MRAEIVCVGTELLLGNVVNTNAAVIARQLAIYGVDVFHHSTVGDNLDRCVATLRTAMARADAVIITGGIGPTPDDCTRESIAALLSAELVFDDQRLQTLTDRYAAWGRRPNESSRKQAAIPSGCQAIANPTGTAWGILVAPTTGEFAGKVAYALPGVPSEMEIMLNESVLPDLRARFGLATGLFQRCLRTRGMGESLIADRLAELLTDAQDPTVATYVKTSEVEVRMTCRAANAEDAEHRFGPMESEIRKRLGDGVVYGVDQEGFAQQIVHGLTARGQTIATAESCTGGLVGHMLTAVPGSSAVYRGGVVAYCNEIKAKVLGVDPQILSTVGAVSDACVRQMARGVAELFGADFGLATSGIAGPGGATPTKPVGLVYLAFYDRRNDAYVTAEKHFTGDRDQVKERSAMAVLEMACQHQMGLKP